MGRKVIAIWLCMAMISGLIVIVDVSTDFSLDVKGITLYVNITGSNGGFSKIQDAIDASNDGDTVFVYSGTYYEHVVMNKSINMTSEDRNTTITDGERSRHVVRVTSDYVNLMGFTITRSGYTMHYAGINLENASFCRISNNILHNNGIGLGLTEFNGPSNYNVIVGNKIFNNRIGIYLQTNSNYNIITNNNISSNSAYGISLYKSSDNIISENRISYSDWAGIAISSSMNNTVTKNILTIDGIYLWGVGLSHYNSHLIPTDDPVNGIPVRYFKDTRNINIDGNILDVGQLILANCTSIDARNLDINNTDSGIQMAHCTDLIIVNNKVSLIDRYGVFFEYSSNSPFSNNNVSFSDYGFRLYRSSDILIEKNIISWNSEGLRFFMSQNNSIYYNIIMFNSMQVCDDMPADNNWFHPVLLEGNFWSDYSGVDDGSGTGKHAIAGDGIGDTLIPHPKADFDFYPLINLPKPEPQALIDIDPDTLNLKSKGRWVTAYITFNSLYDINDIDISTVISEDTIPAEWEDIQGDRLMVKFDRSEVEDMLSPGTYNLKVSGELIDGTFFEGLSDEIRIINPS